MAKERTAKLDARKRAVSANVASYFRENSLEGARATKARRSICFVTYILADLLTFVNLMVRYTTLFWVCKMA